MASEVLADLLVVDVERGDELDVGDVVVTERHVHQTGTVPAGPRPEEIHSLDEGRRRSCRLPRCYSNRPIGVFLPCHAFGAYFWDVACWPWGCRCPRSGPRCRSGSCCARCRAQCRALLRSALMRSESHRTSRSTDSTP